MEIVTLQLNGGNYSAKQSIESKPMTAYELMEVLEGLDPDAPVLVYMGGYGVTHFAVKSAVAEYAGEETEE